MFVEFLIYQQGVQYMKVQVHVADEASPETLGDMGAAYMREHGGDRCYIVKVTPEAPITLLRAHERDVEVFVSENSHSR